MRVLVVDDHEVVRRGVISLLHDHPQCEVCGEATQGQEAVEKAAALQPDVVIMDVSMPVLNGLEATRVIRSTVPSCEILVLSQHDAPEMVRKAFEAGARGYVVKSSIAKDLSDALNRLPVTSVSSIRPSLNWRSRLIYRRSFSAVLLSSAPFARASNCIAPRLSLLV